MSANKPTRAGGRRDKGDEKSRSPDQKAASGGSADMKRRGVIHVHNVNSGALSEEHGSMANHGPLSGFSQASGHASKSSSEIASRHRQQCTDVKIPAEDSTSRDGDADAYDDRPGSDLSSAGDISVDCQREASEVIVTGKNVQSIRLKFPPRPPSGEVAHQETRTTASAPALRRSCRATEHDDQTCAPSSGFISAEQSSFHDVTKASSTSLPYKSICEGEIDSASYKRSVSYTAPFKRLDSCSSMASDGGAPRGTIDYGIYEILQIGSDVIFSESDYKLRQDVLNAMEPHIKRQKEMSDLNKRIMKELKKLLQFNHDLEARYGQLEGLHQRQFQEISELKQKIDKMENEKLQNNRESVAQWEDKVKLKETYIKYKYSKEKEVQNLNKLVEEKDAEIKQITAELENVRTILNGTSSRDTEIEHLTQVGKLKEELDKLSSERDKEKEVNTKLENDVQNLKQKLDQNQNELDKQVRRFMSLKKSFNDLYSEKDQLVALKSRRNSVENCANSTWPVQEKVGSVVKETLPSIDSSQKKSAELMQKKGLMPAPDKLFAHRRSKSQSRSYARDDRRSSPEALPPVKKDVRK